MISKREFQRRRERLMSEIGAGALAIIPSAQLVVRNRDTEYPFRQDSDFYYLTGFDEPNAVLVLLPQRAHGEYILFCQEKDPKRELWDGYRAGPEGACADYQADDAFPVSDIDDILPGLIEGCDRLFYAMGRNLQFDRQLMTWVNSLRESKGAASSPGEFLQLDQVLHDMRLQKSAAEIKLMQRAADISVCAHRRAMQACEPGMKEYQLEAELRYEFLRAGAHLPAYNSIVGGGRNACTLHYTQNQSELRDGTLVLIDAGCEYQYYAADITRTFPVNGRFSATQRALYDAVLAAQLAAIQASQAGAHWNQPHEACVEVLTQCLVDLGILSGPVDKLLAEEAYKEFYMHRTGHWLGMDVHDVGDYRVDGEWRILEPGMALTVEPGLYIAPDNTRVAKKWRGLGVRIEDDVLITPTGPKVLTDALPKRAEDIEALMADSATASKTRRRSAGATNKKSAGGGARKKTARKKPVRKKATSKKVTSKKVTSKKVTSKKVTSKKVTSKKATSKKAVRKKTSAIPASRKQKKKVKVRSSKASSGKASSGNAAARKANRRKASAKTVNASSKKTAARKKAAPKVRNSRGARKRKTKPA